MQQERLRASNSISGIIIPDVFRVCVCVSVFGRQLIWDSQVGVWPRDLSKDESYGSPASYHKSPGFVPELICLVLPSAADTAEQGRIALNLNQIKKNMTLGVVFTRPERHVGFCMKSWAVVRGRASHFHGRLSLSPNERHWRGARFLLQGTTLSHSSLEVLDRVDWSRTGSNVRVTLLQLEWFPVSCFVTSIILCSIFMWLHF